MSDTVIIAGNLNGSPAGSSDGSTVAGSGSSSDPFRSGIIEITSTDFITPGALPPGTPVNVGATAISYGRANAYNTSVISGLIVPPRAGVSIAIQTAGFIDLTTAQWDLVTGGSGGLGNSLYYVSSVAGGKLIAGLPPSGAQISLVGKPLSATRMQLLLTCAGNVVP